MECDLKIVPYNLQMIMDWDSHLNIERNANTAIVRRPGTNQIRLISGRVASVGGVPD